MKRIRVKFNVLNECKLIWKMRMFKISVDDMVDELETRIGNQCPSRSYLNHLMLKNQLEPFLYKAISDILKEYEYELAQEEKRRKKDGRKDPVINQNQEYASGCCPPSPSKLVDRTERYSHL